MRIAALVAVPSLVAVLITGCAHPVSGGSGQTQPTTPTSSAPSSTSPASPSSPANPSGSNPPASSGAPASGAPIAAVIAWIEAGHPADPGRYHSVAREGVTTQLGADIAFSGQGGKTYCTTDAKHATGALACLVELTNPPPRPETAYGAWIGGWVNFDGTDLQVGATRADPGPFINGNGPELANGDTLSFDNYRCRADQAGLFCVNYAHQSAARFSTAGIEPYGCLRSVPPPDGVGLAFNCS